MQSRRRARHQKKALIFLVSAVIGIAVFWVILQRAEYLIVGQGSPEEAGTPEEMSEFFSEVQGKVRLGGTVYTYDHQIESWLIIGTDASGNEDGEGEEYRGTMADFLLLVVLDKTDRTYAFLQIDRNTMMDVTLMLQDGTGQATANQQICTAHWYGGTPEQSCENTVNAVSKLLGKVPIQGYYCLNMEDIPSLNHAVGGVEVTVLSDCTDADPEMKEGATLLLNDEQAYIYVRSRMNVGDGTNKDRMARQRQYMEGFFAKVRQKTSEDPSFLNKLYQQFEDVAVTTMTGKDLSRIMKRVDQGTSRGLFQIDGTVDRGVALSDGLMHEEFYLDKDSLKAVMTDLYHLKKKE